MNVLGRIFSWEEIEQGKIPKLESFTEIAHIIRKDLLPNEKVEAALLCGSVLREDFCPRSDVDCIVIYNDIAVISDLRRLITIAKTEFVPVEMIPIDVRMVEAGIHILNGSFLQHLQRAAKEGGTIKGDLLSILKIAENDPRKKLKETFGVVSQKLNRALCELSRFEKEKRIFNLGKILEAPVEIVRSIVWAKRLPIVNESKGEVLRAYWTIADKRSKNLLEKVLEVGEEYSAVLEKVLQLSDPVPYKEEYTEILGRIEELGQNEIIEFIVHNAQLINQTN